MFPKVYWGRRGRSPKSFKKRSRLDIWKNTFTHRMIDTWNGLDGLIVNCNVVFSFKTHLSMLFDNYRE